MTVIDTRRKIWVCYIEDDEDDILLLQDLLDELSLFSVEFHACSDPREGIDYVLNEEPDVCLIDYRIGAYNGIQVMERLKAAQCQVPMIMLTGQDNHELNLQAMQIGAADYLVKAGLQAHELERAILHALERDRARREYVSMESRFRATFEQAPLGIAHVDLIGNCQWVNDAFCQMFRYDREELQGLRVDQLSTPDQLDAYGDQIALLLTGQIETFSREHLFIRKNGEPLWTNVSVTRIDAPSGVPEYLLLMLKDITQRRRAEEQMRKLSTAVDQAADSIIITDLDGRIDYVNSAFVKLTGYRREEAIGQTPSLLKSGEHDDDYYRKLWGTIRSGEPFRDVLVNRRKTGEIYYEEKVITPLKDPSGKVTHFISTGSDITDRMRTQERLRYIAQHDLLTGLPNRFVFNDRAGQSIEVAKREELQLPVMFLDLDRFKLINDTFGHRVGDLFLSEVGKRVKELLRASDSLARLGGDEFGIILQPGDDAAVAGRVAAKISEAFEQPFVVDGQEMVSGVSIGIALYPEDGDNVDLLLRNADKAMYDGKRRKGGKYRFYTADQHDRADHRLKMEMALRQALVNDEFELVYQPQVSLDGRAVVAAEALLRWRHPDFGMVSPMEFVPILEDTGLIVEVGEWVLRTACQQVKQWREEFDPAIRVAVNVSPVQLSSRAMVLEVDRVLQEVGLPAEALELEVTESSLLDDEVQATTTLREIDALGVSLAMDDFGTGFSSLSYLRKLPVNLLKIDRSFISDCTSDPDAAGLVRAIIAMGLALGMDVLAEGVETETQLAFLKAEGCHMVQGYLISPPVVAQEIPGWLAGERLPLKALG